ncbi:DNA endonuclease RBBP8 isoform X2 [Pseudoliparis swirei]|uniref:DNA endonuclease RBBP8 isoform X2 n=1 Tax=Pseudoliparis swirei TaxID=2059687 RepID=UPI0024BE393F|nr:DNA endonuclease RBBP8 isoform X2 [Pseudoliparis swirei]
MSSPGPSSGTPNPTDPFDDLWRQLRENHREALQELEEKVSKLKKERYLDAQSLEVFHFRTQQLKEQIKTLQDAVTRLEIRLGTGDCDRCAILQENLKSNQDQNLHLIAKLSNETESLEDENRKLNAELQNIKISRLEPQQPSSSDHEEGVIPDSPILPSSLPVANKLRKRKDINKIKHVRYAEMPRANKSPFSVLDKEPVDATKNPGRAQVLVPNTCELDTSQISNDVNLNLEEAVAETCGLELIDKPHMKPEKTAGQQSRKLGFGLKPHRSSLRCTMFRSPEKTTGKSPSLLQSVKRFSEDGANIKAKRIKEESEPEAREEDKQGIQEGKDKPKEGKEIQAELIKGSSMPLSHQSWKKCRVDSKDQLTPSVTCSLKPNGSSPSPAFKKPHVQDKANRDSVGKRRSPQQDLNASEGHEGRRVKVAPSWSIDPALALSMYDSERRGDEEDEEECHGELLDSDRTWVSHSLLQCRGENAQRDNSVSAERSCVSHAAALPGLGEKANDSLDMMFDATAHGEYKSYNNSHLGQSQLSGGGDQEGEDGDGDDDPHENTMSEGYGHKARRPTFAHMAVIRKKDERQKLKATTCKECEIYYAHLPEEAKQKKLSACSRHRYLYVPPCTPENFWEVGFPSTQTCIERGYVREEENPQARTRRRQPFNALFSPKQNQQQS